MTKRTVAQIKRDLERENAELERRRWAPGTGAAGWDACNEVAAVIKHLEAELAVAEADEEERRQRPVRRAVFWAAAAAVASAVAAGGTWWQATHAPPLRVEVVQPPAPAAPCAPGPWRLDLGR